MPRGVLVGAVLAGILFAFAAPGSATLSPSQFDAKDGNLVLNDDGVGANEDVKDWQNAPNFNTGTPPKGVGVDLSQSANDNSYKGGAKHDDVCPEADMGSIPPNKDDLTRLYVSNEPIGGDMWLYMAWERFLDKESSASAHMGFEFNKSTTQCAASTKSANVIRTDGDMLILYDLEGGGTPIFTLMRWHDLPLQSGENCYSGAGTAGCWGNAMTLNGSNSEGAINDTAPISDPISGQTLNFKNQFGEAAINLTAAGVFQSGICQAFGRATLGSRSSGNSFESTQKDFVGPIPVDINNCGSFKIVKQDPSGTNVSGAKFKVYKDDGDGDDSTASTIAATFEPATQDLQIGKTGQPSTATAAECTTGSDGTGDCIYTGLLIGGKYWVKETQAPSGFLPIATPRLVTITSTAQQTVTIVDQPRTYRIVVLVCQESDNTLYPSAVTVDGSSRPNSLSSAQRATAGLSAADETTLCQLTQGARGGRGSGNHAGDPISISNP